MALPLLIAAKNARDLIRFARRTLAHFRALPLADQQRLRGRADRVKTLSAELAAVSGQTMRDRISGASSAAAPGRDAKVVAGELRDAVARLSQATAREMGTVAKGESRKMQIAAKAVGFGARKLDRGSAEDPPAGNG